MLKFFSVFFKKTILFVLEKNFLNFRYFQISCKHEKYPQYYIIQKPIYPHNNTKPTLLCSNNTFSAAENSLLICKARFQKCLSGHHQVVLQHRIWLSGHLVIRVMFKVAANVSAGCSLVLEPLERQSEILTKLILHLKNGSIGEQIPTSRCKQKVVQSVCATLRH